MQQLRRKLFIGFYILLCFGTIEGGHFRGGYISWQVIQPNSSNSTLVSVVIEQVYWWTLSNYPCSGTIGDSGSLFCITSNCSNYVSSMTQVSGPCIASDAGLGISTSQSFSTANLQIGSRLVLRYSSSAWILFVIPGSSSYALTTMIDLGIRSDNGKINSSPVTSMAPIVTVRPGMQQTIRIPLSDADQDVIKCRWANSSATFGSTLINECAGACLNIPGATITSSSDLTNNCTIGFTANLAGYYVAAIQIEDFMPSATNGTPLSSVPLQFVIHCINITCAEPNITGLLAHGTSVSIEPGQTFNTTIYAEAGCNTTTVNRFLTVIGPSSNWNTSAVTHLGRNLYSITVTWKTNILQNGVNQLYCTIAVDGNNMQSSQYCITIYIRFPSTTTTTSSASTPSPTIIYIITTHKEKSIDLPWILGLGIPMMILSGITGYLLVSKLCSRKSK